MNTCVKLSISQMLIEIDINIDLMWNKVLTKYFSFINDILHFEFAIFFINKNSRDIAIQIVIYLYEQKTYSFLIILLKMNSMIDNSFEIEIFFKFFTICASLSHFQIWAWNLLFESNFFLRMTHFLQIVEELIRKLYKYRRRFFLLYRFTRFYSNFHILIDYSLSNKSFYLNLIFFFLFFLFIIWSIIIFTFKLFIRMLFTIFKVEFSKRSIFSFENDFLRISWLLI